MLLVHCVDHHTRSGVGHLPQVRAHALHVHDLTRIRAIALPKHFRVRHVIIQQVIATSRKLSVPLVLPFPERTYASQRRDYIACASGI